MAIKIGKKVYTEGLDVFSAALRRIESAFQRCDKLVVSFSGGKDSTVVLNLALIVAKKLKRLPLDVLFVDEECIHPEVEDYVRRVAQRPDVRMMWSCVPVKHRNASSRREPWYLTWDPAVEERWCRALPAEGLTHKDLPHIPWDGIPHQMGYYFGPEHGSVITLLGRRSDESLTRYRLVAARGGEDCYISGTPHSAETSDGGNKTFNHLRLADPIYDFTTEDVWYAIHSQEWDYCEAYDLMSMMGIGLHAQRVAPPFGEEPGKTLWMWAQGWPQMWDKMQSRVDGADAHARYCGTELYSTANKDLKPDEGESWEEYTMRLVLLWPKEQRKKISHNIRMMINRHINKCIALGRTSYKIPEVTSDPETGICWKVMAQIASRGVLKSRTMGMMTTKYGNKKANQKNTAAAN